MSKQVLWLGRKKLSEKPQGLPSLAVNRNRLPVTPVCTASKNREEIIHITKQDVLQSYAPQEKLIFIN